MGLIFADSSTGIPFAILVLRAFLASVPGDEGGLDMPKKTYQAHPVRDAFAAELRAFYVHCGSPSYTRIIEMAPRLGHIYPDLYGLASLTMTFSKSSLSENLHGRRQTLPDPVWVSCFILCCQRLGFEAGRLRTDPGRGGLPGWQDRLREAENEARMLGLPLRRGPRIVADARTPGPAAELAEPAVVFGASPQPGQDHGAAGVTGPIWLSGSQCEYVAEFGVYGRALLVRALTRDPHAAYQIAVLLAADPARGDEAVSLLTDAAATGHPRALALLQASPRHLDRQLAAGHAHELAELARNTGFRAAARTFRACAARFTPGDTARDIAAADAEDTTDS